MQQDKTFLGTEPVGRLLFQLAVPTVTAQLVNMLYNIVDRIYIGHMPGDGSLALTGVGVCMPLIMIVSAFAALVASGGAPRASIAMGRGDHAGAERLLGGCAALLLLLSLTLTAVLLLWGRDLLLLFGASENTVAYAADYMGVYAAGTVFVQLTLGLNAFVTAQGFARTGMLTVLIGALANIALDPLFIFALDMGVRGAALATIISQFVSVFLCMGRLMNPVSGECQVKWREVRFDPEMTRMILSYGLPSGLQNSVIALANVVVQSNINSFGEMAMSGCGAYAKVEGFAFLPITSFTSAITTFVGQNLGAGELRRTRQGARFGILCSVIIAEAVGALLYWLAPILIKAFTQEPAAIAFGVQKMRTCSLFFCLLALSHCLAAVMRGAGRAVIPMISMLSFWCVVRVAIITVATPIYQSIAVVNWVYPITWALSSIFLLIYYYKADWLTAPGHRSGEPVKH